MKFVFHGAAKEVGKSCIELVTEGRRYLLDAGIKFIQHGVEYPKYLDKIHSIDGVFITHAHLDHSGALPMLENKHLDCPIYMTSTTWQITNLLLEDSYHLEKLKHIHPAYVERDIHKIKHDLRFVKYDQDYETKDKKVKFHFINSGHIPGGASVMLNVEGKTVLYTADMNSEDTNLMIPSDLEQLENEVDVLITENTYGDRMHPVRENSEQGLLDSIMQCIERGGSALVPVFGVGRSQEILIVLNKLDPNIPIYLDGMARKLTNLILKDGDPYVDNMDILEKMYRRVNIVKSGRDRPEIARKKGIVIITTSGMVQGGPVVSYCDKMIHDEKNSIILTGYQANGTNGRSMFEDHMYYSNHQRHHVRAQVKKFDFSAHYGQDSIHKLIQKLKPKHLILQHGDMGAIAAVKKWCEENYDGKVYDPSIGEEIEF